jgi:hypothetical protein
VTPAVGREQLRYSRRVSALPKAILDESARLFHDTRVEQIDSSAHAQFVIQRVLDRGTLQSVRALLAHYGEARVRDFLTQGGTRTLDPRTVSLWTAYFGLSEAACTTKSSLPRRSVFWTD